MAILIEKEREGTLFGRRMDGRRESRGSPFFHNPSPLTRSFSFSFCRYPAAHRCGHPSKMVCGNIVFCFLSVSRSGMPCLALFPSFSFILSSPLLFLSTSTTFVLPRPGPSPIEPRDSTVGKEGKEAQKMEVGAE